MYKKNLLLNKQVEMWENLTSPLALQFDLNQMIQQGTFHLIRTFS